LLPCLVVWTFNRWANIMRAYYASICFCIPKMNKSFYVWNNMAILLNHKNTFHIDSYRHCLSQGLFFVIFFLATRGTHKCALSDIKKEVID